MTKAPLTLLFTLVVVFGARGAVASSPQQSPAGPTPPPAAEQATPEHLLKMAAEQAEAVERARLKVAQDAAREAEARVREELAKAAEVIPVDVEVVISRYQGDKKVSSLPYALTVNAAHYEVRAQHRTILRMGGQVPVPVMAPALGPDGQPITGITGGGPVQYKDIGTKIDCAARPLDDGRFELFISVEDTAVATPAGTTPQPGALPAMRTFASSNTIVLRDGQTRQFTAASDRITGEVVRVDVTLRVVK